LPTFTTIDLPACGFAVDTDTVRRGAMVAAAVAWVRVCRNRLYCRASR
jgi:hypothetical protein